MFEAHPIQATTICENCAAICYHEELGTELGMGLCIPCEEDLMLQLQAEQAREDAAQEQEDRLAAEADAAFHVNNPRDGY